MTTAPRARLRAALSSAVALAGHALDDPRVLTSGPGTTARKSAGGEIDAYAATLAGFVDAALSGDMDKVDLARAHRELLREYGPTVYIAALDDAGVPEEDMEQEDDDAIAAWVDDQLGYVSDFATAVIAARGTDNASETMQGRVDAWVAALRALATAAGLSARKNEILTWHYSPDKEHCATCESLSGQKHRASWWAEKGYIPQEPGSDTLECGGWLCGCWLENTKGEQVLP